MHYLIGKSLQNRYRLDALLGEGGMGAVFRAFDERLRRPVAVKVMHEQLSRRVEFQERFGREARSAARLNHPGVVKVFDSGQAELANHQSVLFIVMEFVDGQNLRDMLSDLERRNQWIPLPEAIELVRKLSQALHYAHTHGVLHRDIKPSNVMIIPSDDPVHAWQPVLTDLGLAHLLEDGSVQTLTPMGTPAYMSPEQAMGEPTDARSDVYSLGIMLYELAARRVPFPARTISEAIQMHGQQPPEPPRRTAPGIPPALEETIMRCLNKSPDARFATANDLATRLQTKSLLDMDSTVPPQTSGGPMSINTIVQSYTALRGPSIIHSFPPPDSSHIAPYLQIQVMKPDRTTSVIRPNDGITKVGRSRRNDLTLNDPNVSGEHLQIENAPEGLTVCDMGSSNGTYLGKSRLLPNIPQGWPVDQVLRLGNHHLGQIPAGNENSIAVSFLQDPQSPGDFGGSSFSRTDASQISLTSDELQWSVEPGKILQIPVTVVNQGNTVEHYSLTQNGLPAEWVTLPSRTDLNPNETEELIVTVAPPKRPQSLAQVYPLSIMTNLHDDATQSATLVGNLTVEPFTQFESELYPARIRVVEPTTISLNNQSNISQRYDLTWRDRANALVFEPPQAHVSVPPAETTTIQFRAELSEPRPLFGGTSVHMVDVEVKSPDEQQKLTLEVLSRARFPRWVAGLLPLLLIPLIALAWFLVARSTAEEAAEPIPTAAPATQIPTETVVVTINQPPTAQDDEANTQKDKSVVIIVTDNDSDADDDTLVVESVDQPTHGIAELNDDNSQITYTPNAGYVGQDALIYIVSDGKGGEDTATVLIAISPDPNQPPTAADDAVTVEQGEATTVDVRANDSDPDGDQLIVSILEPPVNGSADVTDNQIVYTPNEGFSGNDRLTYEVDDGKEEKARAAINITVNLSPESDADSPPGAGSTDQQPDGGDGDKQPGAGEGTDTGDDNGSSPGPEPEPTNTAPTADAGSDQIATDSDDNGVEVVNLDGSGSSDNDGSIVQYVWTGISSVNIPQVASPTIDVPVGSHNVLLTVTDDDGATATDQVLVTINVSPNQPPTAQDDSADTDEDKQIVIAVLNNDFEPDGDNLTVAILNRPVNGQAQMINNTQIRYTPDSGFFGNDSLTYQIDDGNGGTANAQVTITVHKNTPTPDTGEDQRIPAHLEPADGTIFNHFPRDTILRWAPVSDAASYTVEIDCFHCCEDGAWCTDVGEAWSIRSGLSTTSYNFSYVGAQPGRWRVWIIDQNGIQGPKSEWWEFEYTR